MAEIAAGTATWVVGASFLGLIGGGTLLMTALRGSGGQGGTGGTGGGCGGGCPTGTICNPATNSCVKPASCGGCPACPTGSVCDLTTCQCTSSPPPCGGACPTGYYCNTSTNQCVPQSAPCYPLCGPGQYCDELDCGTTPTNGCGTCVQNGYCRSDNFCPQGYFCEMAACGSPALPGCGTCIPTGGCLYDFDCPVGQTCVNQQCVVSGWSFSQVGVSLDHGTAAQGDTITATLTFTYTGPGGTVTVGVYAVEHGTITCDFVFSGTVNLPAQNTPGPATVTLTFTWPYCVDCLIGAQFDITGWVIDPQGTETQSPTCISCLSC